MRQVGGRRCIGHTGREDERGGRGGAGETGIEERGDHSRGMRRGKGELLEVVG